MTQQLGTGGAGAPAFLRGTGCNKLSGCLSFALCCQIKKKGTQVCFFKTLFAKLYGKIASNDPLNCHGEFGRVTQGNINTNTAFCCKVKQPALSQSDFSPLCFLSLCFSCSSLVFGTLSLSLPQRPGGHPQPVPQQQH